MLFALLIPLGFPEICHLWLLLPESFAANPAKTSHLPLRRSLTQLI